MASIEPVPGSRQSPEGDPSPPGEAHAEPARPPKDLPGEAGPGARKHRVPRRPPRTRRVPLSYLSEAYKLQPRDQVILDLLAEHQTLSTPQITAILFTSTVRAKGRLYTLRAQGWVDCFGRNLAGHRLDRHWLLGPLGERWAAAGQGRAPRSPRMLARRMEEIAASPNILHDDGQRQVFVDLLRVARASPTGPPGPYGLEHAQDAEPLIRRRLARWWSPARTASHFAQRLHPDGHGVWEEHDLITGHTLQVPFLLEYDRGTEVLETLVDKLSKYEHLLQRGESHTVLFWLESGLRERHLQQRLADIRIPAGLTVATTSSAAAAADPLGPAGGIWWLAGPAGVSQPSDPATASTIVRRRLRDLPLLLWTVESNPGRPAAAEDPLRALR